MLLWVRPINAMSQLKPPHMMMCALGFLCVCCVMFSSMIGISVKSSRCVGMYILILMYEFRRLFFIFSICRHGDIFGVVEIFVIFP